VRSHDREALGLDPGPDLRLASEVGRDCGRRDKEQSDHQESQVLDAARGSTPGANTTGRNPHYLSGGGLIRASVDPAII
jgi:hypothetical protein